VLRKFFDRGPFSRVLGALNVEWQFGYNPIRSCGRKRLDEASHRQSNVIGDDSGSAWPQAAHF
jgi:hypothetical protein